MSFIDFSYFDLLPENFKKLKKESDYQNNSVFSNVLRGTSNQQTFNYLLNKYDWTPMTFTSLVLDLIYKNKIEYYQWQKLDNFLNEFKSELIVKRDIKHPELYKSYNIFKSTFDDANLFARMMGQDVNIVENVKSAVLDDPQWGNILVYNTNQSFNNTAPEGQFNQNKYYAVGDEADDCSIDVNVNFNFNKKNPIRIIGEDVYFGSVEDPLHTFIRSDKWISYQIDAVKIPQFENQNSFNIVGLLAPFSNLHFSDIKAGLLPNQFGKYQGSMVIDYLPNQYNQLFLDYFSIKDFSFDKNDLPFANKNGKSIFDELVGFSINDDGEVELYDGDKKQSFININDDDFQFDIDRQTITYNNQSYDVKTAFKAFYKNNGLLQALVEQSGYTIEYLEDIFNKGEESQENEFVDIYTIITYLLIYRLYLAVIVRNVNFNLNVGNEVYPLEWMPVEVEDVVLNFGYRNNNDFVDEVYGNGGFCPQYNNSGTPDLTFNNTQPEFKFNNCNYIVDGPDEIMGLFEWSDFHIKYENPTNTNYVKFENKINNIKFNAGTKSNGWIRVQSEWEKKGIKSVSANKQIQTIKYNECKECMS